ncbi:insulin receptor substrate 2 [Hippopotamus amphibius kiboko]|uniref:insulin receptor substrate 2 n=1 Tax=Hippopotamus amphibius kiboko TaxID=575201 RepID=UPI002597FE5E|nr:insulin receptor substrate 2 [Hippopotamus amphibius kiboko]
MASPPRHGPPGPAGGDGPGLNHNNNNNHHSVRKSGYLRKQKHGHKRFFVLRGPGAGGDEAAAPAGGGPAPQPPRLEYYESEKKWRSKAAAPKRVIALDCCLNIHKRADAKHKYLIALYTKDEYFAVAAENEQEQEGWYRALTDLVSEGRAGAGDAPPANAAAAASSAASCGASLPGALGGSAGAAAAEDSYGLAAPAAAAYREVWQVNLKPKGLGQSKNLTGVYRLCLSARTIGFVKLNCEQPSVTLQLMNIRRCGHSDSFFFIEVGRSAVTGPGELWMQADDSVVAQNIHETILEAMKALKELFEFRPRSKSQSSGSSATHPISVPGARRHHHLVNLPPSQTGLVRRSRTDSLAATPPAAKCSSCRVRTASEGDGGAAAAAAAGGGRPGSVAGSPLSPGPVRAPLSRSHTLSGGCGGRAGKAAPAAAGGALQHSRSMSMPVARSPPAATSPGSLSSSSGHGSGSYPPPPGAHPQLPHALHPQRPSSGSASASGSPSDPGFMSLDEYGSSPGDLRAFCGHRSDTPESIAETPPARDGGGGELYGYMSMDRPLSHCGRPYRRVSGDGAQDWDRGLRKRTYSLTTPARQRPVPQPSSASLDEYTLMRATFSGSSGRLCPSCPASSPKVAYHPYPEDYGDIEIGSHRSSSSNLGADDGYMPMTPGVALPGGGGGGGCRSDDYMPMSPTSVSAPKQILQPRAAAAALPPAGAVVPTPVSAASRAFPGSAASYKTSSPAESSPEDSGYMRMWCGSKLSVESADSKLLPNGDYLNMSPSDAGAAGTPPDFFAAALHGGAGEMLRGVPGYCHSSLPRSYKAPYTCNGDNDQYVLMSSPVGRILEEERLESTAGSGSTQPAIAFAAGPAGSGGHPPPPHPAVPSPRRPGGSGIGRPEGFLGQRCRAVRPTRLSLEGLQALPSMHEYPLPPEPKSPGEYINIDFGEAGARLSPPAPPLLASAASSSSLLSASSPASSLGSGTPGTSGDSRQRSPLSDYMNLDFSSPKSPHPGAPGADPVGSLDALLSPEASAYPPLPPRPAAPCSALQPPPPPPPPGELYRLPAAPPAQGPGAASSASSGTGDNGDYTEMAFGVAATPPQPIAAPPKPDGARVSSPVSGLKRLSLMDQVSGVEAFLQAGQPPDPHRGAKVIRADPQGGRRRHSSETFSSTTTVTPVSPSFAHNPKRHNSASVENVSLRKSSEGGGGGVLGGGDEPPTSPRQLQPPLPQQARPWTPSQPGGLVGCPGGSSSPMRRETSAGFQNGLNYIAIDVRDEPGLAPPPPQHAHPQSGDKSAWARTRSLGGLISAVGAGSTAGVCGGPGPGALPSANTYASIDFLTHHLKEATVVKE